jgi:hypothetical protein
MALILLLKVGASIVLRRDPVENVPGAGIPDHYVSKKTVAVNMRSVLLATIAGLANIGARAERREIAGTNFQKPKGFPGRNFRKFAGDTCQHDSDERTQMPFMSQVSRTSTVAKRCWKTVQLSREK